METFQDRNQEPDVKSSSTAPPSGQRADCTRPELRFAAGGRVYGSTLWKQQSWWTHAWKQRKNEFMNHQDRGVNRTSCRTFSPHDLSLIHVFSPEIFWFLIVFTFTFSLKVDSVLWHDTWGYLFWIINFISVHFVQITLRRLCFCRLSRAVWIVSFIVSLFLYLVPCFRALKTRRFIFTLKSDLQTSLNMLQLGSRGSWVL